MADETTITDRVESRASRRRMLAGMGVAAGGGLLAFGGAQQAQATVSDASYYSYGPIRYVDTRLNSGGRISHGHTRTLSIFSGLASYTFAVNLTVINTAGTGDGFLSFYNADLTSRPAPHWSIFWQGSGKALSNFALLDLGSAGLKVLCAGSSAATSTHFIIDVVGYFYTGGAASAARSVPADIKAAEVRLGREPR